MLFSREDVANFINASFEPAWESVRPVPLIHIDFGTGTRLTRTLNGNIATYLCTADGQVLDIVAGVYDPVGFKARLSQLQLLANYVEQEGPAKRTQRLTQYHQGQLEAMKKNEPLPRFVNAALMSKLRIEGGLKAMLVKGIKEPEKPAPTQPVPLKPDEIASFKFLEEDTRANEAVRRRQVSELLASLKEARPDQITKKVYKEILLADLDDPYLGLGGTLFGSYPFKEEDKPKIP